MSRDGMERITEIMLLSVIRQYLPYIFGADAKILNADDLDLPGLEPDFVVLLSPDAYAVVEVKDQTPNTQLRLDAIANQMLAYANGLKQRHPTVQISRVLILNGALSDDNMAYLAQRGIDRVIDVAELQRLAASAIEADTAAKRAGGSTETTAGASSRETVADDLFDSATETLLAMLEDTPRGKTGWSRYQKLVGSMLEFLFCPKLAKPISELRNQAGTNRRDFILPNYADDGFWAFLRSHYAAHFIVVDAKNYTEKVGKTEVLQIANYLSDHGAGLFGLIVSRDGGDYGAEVTQREQWAIYRKMIVILDDADLKQMLAVKSSSGDPSDLIRQKIEDFRLAF